jgi:cyclomaltodextrin glucanotransferase
MRFWAWAAGVAICGAAAGCHLDAHLAGQDAAFAATRATAVSAVGKNGEARRAPGWDFREESVYFVVTDRFVNGDTGNDNLYGDEYRPGQLTFYQGGDFKGLMAHLDHIQAMGFTAIWITPPVLQPPGRYLNDQRNYEAAGYHGYWAWDFSKIDPHLESPGATYDDFIRACHLRGIKVVQDIVTNHGHGTATAPETKWHGQRNQVSGLGLTFDVAADTRDWFNHGGPQIADLMDFNDRNPEVVDWFAKIYQQYQDRGVDAFRIDTVAWMRPEFWAAFTDKLHAHKRDFFMFGEVWTNGDFNWLASYTKLGSRPGDFMNNGMSVLDMPGSAMNTWGRLESTFKGGDFREVDAVMGQDGVYKDASWLVSFLDNHDKPRFNGTGSQGRPAGTSDYVDALNWYFTSRGIPCIYYGTEMQMAGGEDPDNRRVLGREGIAAARSNRVYGHLGFLNGLRRASHVLQKGSQRKLGGDRDWYAFRRDFAGETAVVALNKGGAPADIAVANVENGHYRDLTTGRTVEVTGGGLRLQIPGHDLRVLVKGRVTGKPWALRK